MRELFEKPETQSTFVRTVSTENVKLIRGIPIEFNAQEIRYTDSKFYLYNFDAGQIIQLDSAGSVVRSYGNFGEGPGKFQIIADYFIENDKLYCLDLRNRSFTAFSLSTGELLDYHTIARPFSKALFLESANYVVSSIDSLTEAMTLIFYNSSGVEFAKIDRPYADEGSFTNDGILLRSADMVYHLCHHISKFIAFNAAGEIRYSAKTIENYFDPPVELSDGKGKFLSTSAKTLTYQGCTDDDFLYILSAERASNEDPEDFYHHSPVDVYHNTNGSYASTIYIPAHKGNKVRAISKHSQRFYTIQGNFILVYEKN